MSSLGDLRASRMSESTGIRKNQSKQRINKKNNKSVIQYANSSALAKINADLNTHASQDSKSVDSAERRNLRMNDEGHVVISTTSTESLSPVIDKTKDGKDAKLKGERYSTLDDSPSRTQRHDK